MAVEQSANTIVITDTSGNVTFANRAFEKTTGYTVEEMLRKNPELLKSGRQSREDYEKLWQTISSGNVWHGQFLNKRKNGTFFWEEAVISPVKNSRGNIISYLAVKEDITGRKEAEEALRQAKEEAESASRLKSEFLANMSTSTDTDECNHRFYRPLLENPNDSDIGTKLAMIHDSGKSLLHIINDILDFSKIEAGKVVIEKGFSLS